MAEPDYTKDVSVLQLPLPLLANQIDPPLRDNRDTMAYPFLSLEKGRKDPIEFHENGVDISIAADSRYTIATIWDWDFLIAICSQLNDANSLGKELSPRLVFSPHQILKQMQRGTSGRDYQELAHLIRRLAMTNVITNIRIEDQPQQQETGEYKFSWIHEYWIPQKYKTSFLSSKDPEGEPDPKKPWMVQIPVWLYNAVIRQKEILAVHPDYFYLTGGLERFLYRIGRKSLGHKDWWSFRMSKLHKLSGTKSPLRNFAVKVRKIAKEDSLPELHLEIVHGKDEETVTFFPDKAKLGRPRRGIKQKTA